MTTTQFHAEKREMDRHLRNGNYSEAQTIAVRIAPYIDALCDAADRNDKNPSPIQIWGVDA